MGPASIESHYDEALGVPGCSPRSRDGERAGVDGYVSPASATPGWTRPGSWRPARWSGIAEAAMHAAALLGRGFSVVTTLDRTRGRAWDLAGRYVRGAAPAAACTRATSRSWSWSATRPC